MTDAPVIDEPTEETVEPDADRELKDGVGFHDEGARILDLDPPDLSTEDEPTEAEPEDDSELEALEDEEVPVVPVVLKPKTAGKHTKEDS